MSRVDKIKIELDFLKTSFSTLLVAFLGIISYAFINYDKLSENKVMLMFIGIFLVTLSFSLNIMFIFKKLKQLERFINE